MLSVATAAHWLMSADNHGAVSSSKATASRITCFRSVMTCRLDLEPPSLELIWPKRLSMLLLLLLCTQLNHSNASDVAAEDNQAVWINLSEFGARPRQHVDWSAEASECKVLAEAST